MAAGNPAFRVDLKISWWLSNRQSGMFIDKTMACGQAANHVAVVSIAPSGRERVGSIFFWTRTTSPESDPSRRHPSTSSSRHSPPHLAHHVCCCLGCWYCGRRLLRKTKLSRAPSGCPMTNTTQGRAGLIAWRRSRGGVGAMGKAFYKGGFEPKMNSKEASLILSLKCVLASSHALPTRQLTASQRARPDPGEGPQGPPHAHAPEPPRSRRQPVPRDQGQRSERAAGEASLLMRQHVYNSTEWTAACIQHNVQQCFS